MPTFSFLEDSVSLIGPWIKNQENERLDSTENSSEDLLYAQNGVLITTLCSTYNHLYFTNKETEAQGGLLAFRAPYVVNSSVKSGSQPGSLASGPALWATIARSPVPMWPPRRSRDCGFQWKQWLLINGLQHSPIQADDICPPTVFLDLEEAQHHKENPDFRKRSSFSKNENIFKEFYF